MPGSLPNTFNDNRSTPAPPAVVGFKISKPGFNAQTTSGSNMVFDSSWPSLPIAFTSTFANPFAGGATSTLTLNHNLNYPPLTFIWAYGPDPSGLIANSVTRRFLQKVNKTSVLFDTSTVDLFMQAFLNTATVIHVKCFQLDLSKDIDYTLAPGDTVKQPYDNNYGVRFVKQNKDINSKDLRDFAIHSRAQSPLIQAVKTQDTIVANTSGGSSVTVVQYTSKNVNPVWVYGFEKESDGSYFPAPYFSQANPRLFTNGFTSYEVYSSPALGATVVVLRDPMFAPTQTTVHY